MNKPCSVSPISFEVRRELKRKSLHLPGLAMPFLFKISSTLSVCGLILISLFYYISELLRISQRKPLPLIGYLSRHLTRSSRLDLAPIFLAVGLGISGYYLPFHAALAGALLVCLCDGFAALVGMSLGKRKIFGLKKTYAGTFAFFISGVAVLIPIVGWKGAAVTALAASCIEALSIEGVDNLLLPVLGGAVAGYFL